MGCEAVRHAARPDRRSVARRPQHVVLPTQARRARIVRATSERAVTTQPSTATEPRLPRPGASGRRARRRPARAHDARGEGRAARQRWVFQLADGDGPRRSERSRAARRTGSARSRASPARAASTRARRRELANAIQRHLVERDAARHPGDRARGDLLRADGARRDGLPAGDRAREHLGARRSSRRWPTRSARQMRAVGAHQGLVAGARRLPRPALGPHRGDVRRGSVPRRADGRRVRARPPGRRPARRASSRRRSTSSATAPPRAA